MGPTKASKRRAAEADSLAMVHRQMREDSTKRARLDADRKADEPAPSPPRDVWLDAVEARHSTARSARFNLRYTLAEPRGEPTSAELEALATSFYEPMWNGRPPTPDIVKAEAQRVARVAWRLGARPKPEGA